MFYYVYFDKGMNLAQFLGGVCELTTTQVRDFFDLSFECLFFSNLQSHLIPPRLVEFFSVVWFMFPIIYLAEVAWDIWVNKNLVKYLILLPGGAGYSND